MRFFENFNFSNLFRKKKIDKNLLDKFEESPEVIEEFSKGLIAGGTLFEELGFFYLGPIDGHNLDHLLTILQNVKSNKLEKPIFLHIVTKKGKGYPDASRHHRPSGTILASGGVRSLAYRLNIQFQFQFLFLLPQHVEGGVDGSREG